MYLLSLLAYLALIPALAPMTDGQVTLPLADWNAIQQEMSQDSIVTPPLFAHATLSRTIKGAFYKGLFKGSLALKIQVWSDQGHVRIPVLDSSASIGEVRLNDQASSLRQEGEMFTIGVDAPGIYTILVTFFLGKEQDRFERRLKFNLPDAGITEFAITVPEQDIETTLQHGVLLAEKPGPAETELQGFLDGSGMFDLSWSRKITHAQRDTLRTEARLTTLFTVQEAVIAGLTVIDLHLLEGETDRIDLRLPEHIEIVEVEGDDVLQWKTEARNGSRLIVLLRYLIHEKTRLTVHFQFPTGSDEIFLHMPLPEANTAMLGAAGIQAPAGLNITIREVQAARALEPRDIPPELASLTNAPLLYGFVFEAEPRISLKITRYQEVRLVSTIIDDIQASSVIIEDGSEISKLKMKIRNNTRQYMKMTLPAGASLTHALLEGRPIRPALVREGDREALLLPLQQSERLRPGEPRYHTVRPGETLSEIANFYYSDPGRWRYLLDNNRDQLSDSGELYSGQRLKIPANQGVSLEESSFVMEIAYKKAGQEPLGICGQRAISFPTLDIEAMKLVWHIYFPEIYQPLAFASNLRQLSAIRYDLFRRFSDFLEQALYTRAWAGEKGYRNILLERKALYQEDYAKRSGGETVLTTFPLVGHKYRFKRDLLGLDTPKVRVIYAPVAWRRPIQWSAFGAALLATLLLLRSAPQRPGLILACCLLGLISLILGHYFLGVYRKLLWGIDVGLLLQILFLRGSSYLRSLQDFLKTPWHITKRFTFGNLLLLMGLCLLLHFLAFFPMLFSLSGLVLLTLWWRQAVKTMVGREKPGQ
jgi:hypothetical protein